MRLAIGLLGAGLFFGCTASTEAGGADTTTDAAADAATDGASTLDGGSPAADGGDVGPAADAMPTGWTGTTTGAGLFVQVNLTLTLLSPPSAYASVSVRPTATSGAISGATVTITPEGGAAKGLGGSTPMVYQGNVAFAPSYELSVTHASGTRTGIRLVPPRPHTPDLAGTPKVGTPITATWTPNGEADVKAYVIIGKYGTPSASPLPDTGSFEVPGSAFTSTSSVVLQVQRQLNVIAPNEVSFSALVTGYKQGIAVSP